MDKEVLRRKRLEEVLRRKRLLRLAAQAVEKVHSGDSISNAEIQAALEVFPPVVEGLAELGSKFYLAWKELMFDLKRLEEFKRARENRLG